MKKRVAPKIKKCSVPGCINRCTDNNNFCGECTKIDIAYDHKEHSTGAVRSNDADDQRHDLISPIFLEEIAKVLAEGAEKYGVHNWRLGFAWSDVMKHFMKHLNEFRKGDHNGEHLAHMACNLMFLIEYRKTHPELNDLLTEKDYSVP